MIDERDLIDAIEPERYELFDGPSYNFAFDRRDFIKAFGLGIVFIVPVTRAIAQQRGESGRGGSNERLPNDIGAWIHIDEDGGVTVFTGKVEVGQNTRTTLTQSVADELHVPLNSVHLVMGDTDRVPFDMGTFGSRSTPTMAPQLRKAAAAAREMLIAMAAEQMKVAPGDLRIIDARFVNHDKSKTLTLAEVAKGRKLVKVIPDDITITQPKDWTIAGYIATCAEIAIEPPTAKEDPKNKRVRIVRVVEAFDCGAVVNPLQLKNQIEGAITQAIGGALFESIQFENGRVLNPKFSSYRVPRFSDLPLIEIVLVDRKDIPSAGAGETPIVGLAPAVANAIFNATGVRLRSLPLVPKGLNIDVKS